MQITSETFGGTKRSDTRVQVLPACPLPEGLQVARETQHGLLAGLLRPRDLQLGTELDDELRVYGADPERVRAFFQACTPAVVDLSREGEAHLHHKSGIVVRYAGIVESAAELQERIRRLVGIAQRLDRQQATWA